MSRFDLTAAREAYENKESAELVRIAYFEPEFLPEAVDLAREVLASRGISSAEDDLVKSVEAEIAQEQKTKERLANEPLHVGWKIYCFLVADLVAIIVAILKTTSGKKRAAREAMKWFFFGWAFRAVVIAGFVLF